MAAPWEQAAGRCGGEASLHGGPVCFSGRPASRRSPTSLLRR